MLDQGTTSSTAWITAGSTLAGVLFGLFGQFFTSLATVRRERETRKEERRDAAKLRQNEFQRETLLALQEAVNGLRRDSGDIDLALNLEKLRTGKWNDHHPLKLINRAEHHYYLVAQYSARVLDEAIRSASLEFQRAFYSFLVAKSEASASIAIQLFRKQQTRMHDLIGERLRALEETLIAW